MCAECGADLRKEENTARARDASVAMVHSIPELKVSDTEARNIGQVNTIYHNGLLMANNTLKVSSHWSFIIMIASHWSGGSGQATGREEAGPLGGPGPDHHTHN